MRKIAICDDEQACLDSVSSVLAEYGSARDEHFIIEPFLTSSALLDALERGAEYDIYLLDIYMPGVTGMSVAGELRRRSCDSPILFLTSTPDFALQAFGVNATHYLVKPFGREEFFSAMDKALNVLAQRKPQTILLRAAGGYHNLSVRKIVYCESDNHNQTICLSDGETLSVRISSSELWEKLSGFGSFFRCGKTYILHLEYIDKLLSDAVHMQNGHILTVPRRTMPSLKHACLDYWAAR